MSQNQPILPGGQPVIQTRSLDLCQAFIKLLADPERVYPTIGLVYGPPGIGKTTTIDYFLSQLYPQSHTKRPAVVRVHIKSRASAKALAPDIIKACGDKPQSTNDFERLDEAINSLERTHTRLLVADDADDASLEALRDLRYIYDELNHKYYHGELPYPFRILLIGNEAVDKLISRHEQFNSRVGLRHKFEALKDEEVLQKFLPQIVFPRWQYDPDNQTDREMGEWIWKVTNPCLRKVFDLLQTADQFTRNQNAPVITLDLIKQAQRQVRNLNRPKRSEPTPPAEQSDTTLGPHEREAVARQNYKQRR